MKLFVVLCVLQIALISCGKNSEKPISIARSKLYQNIPPPTDESRANLLKKNRQEKSKKDDSYPIIKLKKGLSFMGCCLNKFSDEPREQEIDLTQIKSEIEKSKTEKSKTEKSETDKIVNKRSVNVNSNSLRKIASKKIQVYFGDSFKNHLNLDLLNQINKHQSDGKKLPHNLHTQSSRPLKREHSAPCFSPKKEDETMINETADELKREYSTPCLCPEKATMLDETVAEKFVNLRKKGEQYRQRRKATRDDNLEKFLALYTSNGSKTKEKNKLKFKSAPDVYNEYKY